MNGSGAMEIVIEPVLDHWADCDLRIRPERLHRLGQHMRGVVADELERAGIVARNELERRISIDGVGKIDKLAVADRGNRALG